MSQKEDIILLCSGDHSNPKNTAHPKIHPHIGASYVKALSLREVRKGLGFRVVLPFKKILNPPIGGILGLCWSYMGIIENKMETTI